MHACAVAHKTLTANQPQATLRSDVTYLRCEIVSKHQTDNGTTIAKINAIDKSITREIEN